MATSKKYLVGTEVGQWHILEEVGRNSSYSQLYKARCTRCGYITDHATIQTLKKDIPCMQHIKAKWPNTKLKYTFENMHARCYNPNTARYDRYGGRGIKICDEWLYDRNKFIDWAMNNGFADDLTIDRIDNDGDYTPDNCRWVTQAENNLNRVLPFKREYEYNGKKYSLRELSELISVDMNKLRGYRDSYGVKKLIELIDAFRKNPNMEFPNNVKRMITVDGMTKSISDWDRYLGTADTRYIGDWAKKPGRTDEMVAERIRKLLHGEMKVRHRSKKYVFNIHGHEFTTSEILGLTTRFVHSRAIAKRVKRNGFEATEKYLNRIIDADTVKRVTESENVIPKTTLKIKLGTNW